MKTWKEIETDISIVSEYVRLIFGIAEVCHEANRGVQEHTGEEVNPPWKDAPLWMKESAIRGVLTIVEDMETTPEQSHGDWLAHKEAEGWKYGPVKDFEKKEHPCMVPYGELDPLQKVKDSVFRSIVLCSLSHRSIASDMVPAIRRILDLQ